MSNRKYGQRELPASDHRRPTGAALLGFRRLEAAIEIGNGAIPVGIVIFCVVVSLTASGWGGELDYLDSKLQLRLRKRADVSLNDREENSDATVPEDQNRYHYRLRAGVEAGWESGVSLGTALQAQGLWDNRNSDERNELGISEAYLGFDNIWFLPISVTAGRQTLNRGRGLLLSDYAKDWSFDALEVEYDDFPLTWKLAGARTTHLSPDTELEWLAIISSKWEPATPYLRNGEIYGGLLESDSGSDFGLAGVRSEFALSPELDLWYEIAYEKGRAPDGRDLSAWIADTGFEYALRKLNDQALLEARGTVASGGKGDLSRDFVPLMDRQIGGLVLRPKLSNIQIYKLGLEFPFAFRTTTFLELFQYRRNEAEPGVAGKSGWMYDGLTLPAEGDSRDLGWEANLGWEMPLKDHLTLRFIAGFFDLGAAYIDTDDDEVVEGWLEIVWQY